jgi:hypothetical protein
MKFALPSLAALLSVLLLGACATIERPPNGLAAPGSALHMVDPRFDAAALQTDFTERLKSAHEPFTILSLSGGGANGAYGAGVIVGWTQTGTRPKFSVVTGVSTGALAAPFAFLGPEWNDRLEAAYARGAAEGLLSWRHLSFLVSPSLYSARQLKDLVYKNVTTEMLRAVAAENAKGRRLLVSTTNLDSQETTIWDMGLLATQGDAPALTLFRKILLASASIPGVFPPVFIVASGEDGRLIQQMHVDGGVNAPFLAVPEDMLLYTSPHPPPPGSTIYILVNGVMEREHMITPGSLRAILARTLASAGISTTRVHLASTGAFAARNGMGLQLAAIPKGTPAALLDFSEASMSTLFEEGRTHALAGTAWQKVIPETAPAPDAAQAPSPKQDAVPAAPRDTPG